MSVINEGVLRLLRRNLYHGEGGDNTEDGPTDALEGWFTGAFKIFMILVMIVCAFLAYCPKNCKKCQQNENALSFLNCFASGIFLAMALVQMMPES